MKKRSFSFLLARRYLNPRRSVLSSFSLISLLGVMLGVLVLVVVMAVYAGLERNVKSRILGFTPHILMQPQFGPLSEWQPLVAQAQKLPHVAKATPYVSDNAILDIDSFQKPVMFSGVDSSDSAQMKSIELDLKNYPTSSADLGIDDRVIISSTLAEQYKIGVGQKLRLYSTRNFDQVLKTYKATERPPVREAFAEDWKKIQDSFKAGWKTENGQPTLSEDAYREVYNTVLTILDESIREPEANLLVQMYTAMDTSEKDEAAKVFRFTPEHKKELEDAVIALNSTEVEKMDGDTLKGLKQVVLPKEAEVIGVYQTSQMAVTPDLFIPLPLAQDLAGLEDGIQGISLRLDDPYIAGQAANQARQIMGPDWKLLTWMEQYEAFFALIEQQRVMMYFALSFIVLVSAFSMMAVMFTVTIQKRREIGVMKALGAAPGQIVRVFLYQGMILGLLGAGLGIGLGRLVIHYRGPIQVFMRKLNFDPFSASFTGFNELPAFNNPKEQLVIGICSFILCSLAALVPAFFAARSDAAKSLRNL